MTSEPVTAPSHPPESHVLDSYGRTVGVLAGSLLFPAGAFLNVAFQPYIHLNEALHQGLSPSAFLSLLYQLNALSTQVLLGRILPMLLLGFGGSTLFLLLGGFMGQRLTRFLRLRLL